MNNQMIQEKELLHYTVEGSGPPVVLVHGFAASSFDWVYLKPDLLNSGYQVIAPDLMGHGDSNFAATSGIYTFDVFYQHFANWCQTHFSDQKITIIGHSMGGLISLYYAYHNPSMINNLVLINPLFDKTQLKPWMRYLASNAEFNQKALQIAPSWLVKLLASFDLRGLIHYENHTWRQKAEDISRAAPEIAYLPDSIPDIRNQIPEIHTPTYVIWGNKDTTLDPGSFQQLVEALPNGTGQEIPGCGHQPHLAKPELINRLAVEFLSNHPAE